MSYKYSKGSTVQGDIKAADDSNRDTMIDFEEDRIDLKTGGSTRFKISGSNGNITFNEAFTFPNTDGNTNQVLTTDGAGVLTFKTQATGSGANPPGGADRQVQFNDNGSFAGNHGILVDSNFNLKVSGSLISKEAIGIGIDLGGGRNASNEWVAITEPQNKFHVVGDINEASTFSIDSAANSAGGSYWTFAKARGTPSSPAGVNTNDEIARIQFFAHTGSSTLKRSAMMIAQADSDGDGRLRFYVTKGGDQDNIAIECYDNQVKIQDQMVIGSSGIIPISNGGASIGGSSNRFDYMRANKMVAYESFSIGGTHPIYDRTGFGIQVNDDIPVLGNYTSGEGLVYVSNSSVVENVLFTLHKTGSHFGGIGLNGTATDSDQKIVFFSQHNTAGFEWKNNIPTYGSNGMGNLNTTGTTLMQLESNGSLILSASTSKIGIGTTSPDYTLDVAGDIGVDQKIIHNGDADTLIRFDDDQIILKAGNISMVKMEKKGSAPHEVTINDGSNNIDFIVKGNGSNAGNPGMKFDASTNRVGINGVGSPDCELHVDGDIKATGNINAKQRFINSTKFSSTDTSQRYVRWDAAGSNGTPGVNNKFVAPCDGELLSVTIRSTSAADGTNIAFHKASNGTADLNTTATETIGVDMSAANTTYQATFSGSTFSAGEILGISMNPSSQPNDVNITCVWLFDWNS